MSIEKMKKLSVVAVKSDRKALVDELLRLGCVEISQPEPVSPEEEAASPLHHEATDYNKSKADYDELIWAIGLLDKYAPKKTGFLEALPEVAGDELMDLSGTKEMVELATHLDHTDDRIKRIEVENARIASLIESLTPWQSLDLPLNTTGTKTCFVRLGTLPATLDLEELRRDLAQKLPESICDEISSDTAAHYVEFIIMRSDEGAFAEFIQNTGFSAVSVSDLSGTAAQNIEGCKRRLEELADEEKQLTDEICAAAVHRDELKLCSDRLLTLTGKNAEEEKFLCTQSTFTFTGWIPARELGRLESVLSKYDCAWDTADPTDEETPEVPVKLRNNRLTRPLQMVTDMYSLPSYDNVDPNPLMAPFFILFYGIMMADMGYGILMVLAGLLILKKKKPLAGTRNFMELLVECGVSTFVWGAITGGFFGDAPLQIARMINPATTWTGLPYLFSPLDDTIMILIGSLALGMVHIITGMAISVVEKFKAHEYLSALFEEITWWIIFAGIGCMALGAGNIVLYIGAGMIVLGSLIQGKGMGKITGIVGSLYNNVTGFFGDILSYSRLMALMLAGSVIAQVFNTLAASTGNVVAFIIIFMLGHALNFGLNLLGCYVHDMRLQCLEYFGKFYKDGGRPFEPLQINSKYYVANN